MISHKIIPVCPKVWQDLYIFHQSGNIEKLSINLYASVNLYNSDYFCGILNKTKPRQKYFET